ncbi:penicillin acylase family protein [Lacibacter luteus]|uniref:Penicillin acylase family protein n=1 Tax=Lacibacter luteus TaxID=2508719 RepID=A0A4Q1CLE3_9BACT|nr:penicillin acylase family protein [Lacibacter luteus]RXK61848.1 penicillin acylase family protein [Lacibacter luteus]
MRLIPFLISSAVTIGLVYTLNTRIGPAPALGKFLSPQHGFWQNAEPADKNFSEELRFPQLSGNANVYFDERLVPHVVADNDADAYFIQGYLHAKFRLWQMEFSTHAAAGRISEIIGERAVNFDKEQRRIGMVFAAENMLKEMEVNEFTKLSVDNYTKGVNAYIETLAESELPIEYKILGYSPEKWNNLKTALFIKQMTKTLAFSVDDLPLTALRKVFSDDQIEILYPQLQDSLDPIVPKGTTFAPPAATAVAPVGADSVYLQKKDSALKMALMDQPSKDNGSNNWAVSGAKTKSGAPILCNDPHLELSLPAIWYEMQITTNNMNAYGVSFPGIPGVVIGFNDSIAFGFTNAGRDVRDFYEIKFKDNTKKQYWFNNEWRDAPQRIEEIKVKGKPAVFDTVAYTVFGPVTYDESFTTPLTNKKAIATRWIAHDPSNELLMWHYLDRAKNYDDYYNAIKYFTVPAQNMIFASKRGDIAIWQQGHFPLRWNRQGLYVMPGQDSSYMWQGIIPPDENPHQVNPERGFVSSANQRPVDGTYPYFIPGGYDVYRGLEINRRLAKMNGITTTDMQQLQNVNYNPFAEVVTKLMKKYTNASSLSADEKRFFEMIQQWDLQNNINSKAATVFQVWFDSLETKIWYDELTQQDSVVYAWPYENTLADALTRDSAFSFIDDINTTAKETIYDVFAASLKAAIPVLLQMEKEGKLEWGAHKNTTVYHMLKDAVMPFARKGLAIGGGKHIINAAQHSHGPSWRMIVELTNETDAYVVYPGGQSGNPGSKYYDLFIDTWAAGKYYKAWVMKKGEEKNAKVKWTMTFKKV